jgi:hypothetical protein
MQLCGILGISFPLLCTLASFEVFDAVPRNYTNVTPLDGSLPFHFTCLYIVISTWQPAKLGVGDDTSAAKCRVPAFYAVNDFEIYANFKLFFVSYNPCSCNFGLVGGS